MKSKHGYRKRMFNKAIKYCIKNNIDLTMRNLKTYLINFHGVQL